MLAKVQQHKTDDNRTMSGHILVVDDKEENRVLLSRQLDRYGHSYATASDGFEAMAQLRDRDFDLVLLDIMMPRMNGYEVLEQMKAHPRLRLTPVIVISAYNDLKGIARCIELGAEDYLAKPYDAVVLQARITASLEKKRAHEQELLYLRELDTLQRIDRELNATLDMQHVLQILLHWAVRQEDDGAGLAGVVDHSGLRVLTSFGYMGEIDAFDEATIPLDRRTFIEAMESGELQVFNLNEGEGILKGARSQLVAPLMRRTDVLGFVVLESQADKQWRLGPQRFISRLCDHAAIALHNAQLFNSLQEANAAKSDFVSFVSHELKTPMTAIRGYTELLASGRAGDVSDVQVRFLDTIRSSVDRMARLVADLSDLSRIEAGRLTLEFEGVDLAEVIRDVTRLMDGQLKTKEQQLELDLAPDLPEIWGDRGRLNQVLTNLISNAYKYTQEGGHIRVRAFLDQHAEPGDAPREVVHIAIIDDGVGIPEDEQKFIFTKFFRASDQASRQQPGTGLGLNITQQLLEMHAGHIWFESEYGEGTTFHVTLPIPEMDRISSAR